MVAVASLILGLVCVVGEAVQEPNDVVEAAGYGCTSSAGATLVEFEVGGAKYCSERFTTVGASTWTRPAWVTTVDLFVVGGGGGGAVACSSSFGAGGGGGGGVAIADGYSVSADTYAVTVGGGGLAGQGGNCAGSTGGTSRFDGASGVTATGGSGGINTTSTGTPVTGGASGVGSHGPYTSSKAGGNGEYYNGSPQMYSGGGGGGALSSGSNGKAFTTLYNRNVDSVSTNFSRISWYATPYGGSGPSGANYGFAQNFGCGGGGGSRVRFGSSSGWRWFGQLQPVGGQQGTCLGKGEGILTQFLR